MEQQKTPYFKLPVYELDAAATREVWGCPGVIGVAGTLIFLCYAAIPPILEVGASSVKLPRTSTSTTQLRHGRERTFLERLVGLTSEKMWQGGLSNNRVRAMISELGHRHLQFSGMRERYMTIFATIIALAPLRVLDARKDSFDAATQREYWRYMTFAFDMLGVHLPSLGDADLVCQSFLDENVGVSRAGRSILGDVLAMYPEYYQGAFLALYPSVQRTIVQLLEDLL